MGWMFFDVLTPAHVGGHRVACFGEGGCGMEDGWDGADPTEVVRGMGKA